MKGFRKYYFTALIMSILAFSVFTKPTLMLAASPEKTITLKYASWVAAPPGWFARSVSWYLDEVEKRSTGRVKFERFWAKTIADAGQMLESTQSGICDVAMISAAYYGAKLPLLSLGQVPGTYDYIYDASMALYDLYTSPAVCGKAMRDELARYNVRFLSPSPTSPYYLLTKTPVTSLSDIKGRKIIATGTSAKVISVLDGVPISLTGPETYGAMEKGVVDGIVYGLATVVTYSLQEVAKNYFLVPLGNNMLILGINQKTWNSLPPDIQKLMDEIAVEHGKHFQRIYQEEGDGEAYKKFAEAGVKVTHPSGKILEEYENFLRTSVWKDWIKERQDKGLPAKEVMEFFLERVKYHGQFNPFKK